MATRKVQLWRWVDEEDEPVPALPTGPLHRALLAWDRAGVDLTHGDAHGFRTQVEPVPGSTPHLILHRLRDTELPSERRNGRIVPLDPNVKELAEGSHVRFLESNLVAFIGNGISPRPGRLAGWVRDRVGWDVWLQPVLRKDLGTVLDNIRKVSNVELAISADEVGRLDMAGFFEGDDDPLRVFQAAERFQQGGNIRLQWSVGLGGNHDQSFFRSLVQRIRRADMKDFNVAKAKIYVDDGDSVPVDFIHDKVVVEIEMDDQASRQRTLPNNVARAAFAEAWEHFKSTENVLADLPSADGTPLELPADLIPIPHG